MKYNLRFGLTTVIVTVCASFSFAQSPSWITKVDPAVLNKLQNGHSTEFLVVFSQQADLSDAERLFGKYEKADFVYKALTKTASTTQSAAIAILQQEKVFYRSFWLNNTIWTVGDAKLVQTLAELPSVSTIIENASLTYHKPIIEKESTEEHASDKTHALEWGISKTKADQVWALGYKGKGAVVAGEDTGYEWEHPAIKNQYRGWNGSSANHNYNWHDAVPSGGGSCGANSKEPCDDSEHGTHTMGTMVGLSGSNQIGMAPEAKWIGCRNMNVNNGTLSSYIECFQFFMAPTDLNDANPDTKKAPDVINNSWGCPTSEGCNKNNFATMEKVVNNLRAAGIVVVVSAGNDGPDCSTINTPAPIFKGSFSVGSTTSSDAASSFSSRGNVTVDGSNRMKPDIAAPGSGVRSCVPGGGYSAMSGTSMAGPHVAGLVALIISANPSLRGRVADIEEIIKTTAVKLTTTQACGGISGSAIPNNTFGYGRIDALAAVKKAVSLMNLEKAQDPIQANVYPNPFNDRVSVQWKANGSNYRFELYTVSGQQVKSEALTSDLQEFDLSELPAGLYFYKILGSEATISGKLVRE